MTSSILGRPARDCDRDRDCACERGTRGRRCERAAEASLEEVDALLVFTSEMIEPAPVSRLCFTAHRRAYAFPCDAQGHVNIDELTDRSRTNYFFARAAVGTELSAPIVLPVP